MKKSKLVLATFILLSLFILSNVGHTGRSPSIHSLIPVSSAATCCNYNFSVSPGSYDSNSGVWTVPPNTQLTVNGSTNDLSVTLINMTGNSADGFRFTVKGSPSSCGTNCLFIAQTIPASNDKAGDTWNVVVNFSKGSSGSTTTRGEIFPSVIVAPEFPFGSLVAIAAPLGAIGFYIFARRRYATGRAPHIY